jgi:prepilin-type N-terminal cleavage/methylation domain-containing protein/prepilin-type processing-associated H-X9-DG protein
MRNGHCSGFTLVELLVVISIIAVLVAILIPVLTKARESGRTAVCISNQRQLAAALTMWSQDHDEMLPVADTAWQDLELLPKLLVCPTAGKNRGNGYVYNAFVADKPLGDASFEGNESHIIVTADGSGAGNIAVRRTDVDLRHNGKAVAAFLDGHVQQVQFGELAGYHVGMLIFKPVPFTSNSRFTATILPEGTTIACTGPPDYDWVTEITSDPIHDVPEGSFCRLEFRVDTPDLPFACGIVHTYPRMAHGFTDNWPSDNRRISFWEWDAGTWVYHARAWYNTTSLYAIERQPNGTVQYLVDDRIAYTSERTTTAPLQFHFNSYRIGARVRNLRYSAE